MVNADLAPKVTRVRASPQLLPDGAVQSRMLVEYMVGTHGPFTLTLLAAEFTAARAQQEMEKVAAEIRQLPISA